jgi:rhamnogalacturonyl hydrolase YesR
MRNWTMRLTGGAAVALLLSVAMGGAAAWAQVGATKSAGTAISPAEQRGIDGDIAQHIGDAPESPGLRAHFSTSLRPRAVRAAMSRVAEWELARTQPYFGRNWTWGVLYTGFMAASRALDDPRYRDAMQAMAEKHQWELRSEDPIADDQVVGQTYLELDLRHPAAAKIAPTRAALDSLMAGENPAIPKEQAKIPWWWCDALFMAPPVWARMDAATHEAKYLAYVDQQWWETSGLLYDQQRHLYYRDITYLHRKDQRGNPIFWSRGKGWVMGGLARTLEYMPKSDPERGRYMEQLRQMAAAVAKLQDPHTGLWHSDLLDAEDYPQPETSGSALMTFAMAWGVNHEVLDRAAYLPTIRRAWAGLVRQIYADGRLGNIQQTGAGPAHYRPSSSYNYGVGAFLLAGEQVAKLGRPGQGLR